MIDINTGYANQSGTVEVSDKDLLKAIHQAEQRNLGVTPIQYSNTTQKADGTRLNLQDESQRYNFLQTYVFDWKGSGSN